MKTILGLAAVLALPMGAMAIPIVYDITSDHATGGLGTAPFGTVTLNQNGTTVDVTVHLYSDWSFVKTGSVDDMAFKFNAVDVVLTDISIDSHTPALQANYDGSATAYNGDGTGIFHFGISAPTQGNGASDPFTGDIIFHVASATIADLTQANNLGILFVADLYSDITGKTGPADVTPGTSVPDGGATALLLGAALTGIGLIRRKLS